jgi:hypothetical protein
MFRSEWTNADEAEVDNHISTWDWRTESCYVISADHWRDRKRFENFSINYKSLALYVPILFMKNILKVRGWSCFATNSEPSILEQLFGLEH